MGRNINRSIERKFECLVCGETYTATITKVVPSRGLCPRCREDLKKLDEKI